MTMKFYWIILNVGWLIAFAAGETYAIVNKSETLSQWVWTLSATWPMAIAITGLVVGVLLWHFYGSALTVSWKQSVPPIAVFLAAMIVGFIAARVLWISGG